MRITRIKGRFSQVYLVYISLSLEKRRPFGIRIEESRRLRPKHARFCFAKRCGHGSRQQLCAIFGRSVGPKHKRFSSFLYYLQVKPDISTFLNTKIGFIVISIAQVLNSANLSQFTFCFATLCSEQLLPCAIR